MGVGFFEKSQYSEYDFRYKYVGCFLSVVGEKGERDFLSFCPSGGYDGFFIVLI